jgi:hypothetical protein
LCLCRSISFIHGCGSGDGGGCLWVICNLMFGENMSFASCELETKELWASQYELNNYELHELWALISFVKMWTFYEKKSSYFLAWSWRDVGVNFTRTSRELHYLCTCILHTRVLSVFITGSVYQLPKNCA